MKNIRPLKTVSSELSIICFTRECARKQERPGHTADIDFSGHRPSEH